MFEIVPEQPAFMKITSLLLVALLACIEAPRLLSAEASAPAALQGDAARPSAAHWLRSELYFGVGRADAGDPGMSEEQWRAFLDTVVTPRFPDGLTVFDAYGQWQNRPTGQVGRLRTKVLVILHEDTPARRAAIDEIRAAWKTAHHAQSVLLVMQPAEVSF